jgi:hypothetical protein
MTMTTKRLLGAVLLGHAVIPMAAAAPAAAAGDLEHAASAGAATGIDAQADLLDAVEEVGLESEGADGLETEFSQFDPRFVEGPACGPLEDTLG